MTTDIRTLLGDPEQIKEQYQNSLFDMLETDHAVRNFVNASTNNLPIKMNVLPPAKGSTISTVVITRGKFFGKKQTMSLKVQNDHSTYFSGYLQLELLFAKFLENDNDVSDALQTSPLEKTRFTSMFSKVNIEMLPELMYWINHIFTGDISRWVRFKKLFMAIDLSIDPVIVDTVKFKLLRYLLAQRKLIILHGGDTNDESQMLPSKNQYLDHAPDPQVLHKVMDLYIFLPYAYLFFVYKNMVSTSDETSFMTDIQSKFQAVAGPNSLI